MVNLTQIIMAQSILNANMTGRDRLIDVDIAMALGWRVSKDEWWNCKKMADGNLQIKPNGDEYCIRRDARNDVPCNENLPEFTSMPKNEALKIIAES